MSGETKKSNRFRKNIKKNWKEITMANIIDDETIEYVGILAKLALSEEEKEQAKKDMSDMLDYIDMLGELYIQCRANESCIPCFQCVP